MKEKTMNNANKPLPMNVDTSTGPTITLLPTRRSMPVAINGAKIFLDISRRGRASAESVYLLRLQLENSTNFLPSKVERLSSEFRSYEDIRAESSAFVRAMNHFIREDNMPELEPLKKNGVRLRNGISTQGYVLRSDILRLAKKLKETRPAESKILMDQFNPTTDRILNLTNRALEYANPIVLTAFGAIAALSSLDHNVPSYLEGITGAAKDLFYNTYFIPSAIGFNGASYVYLQFFGRGQHHHRVRVKALTEKLIADLQKPADPEIIRELLRRPTSVSEATFRQSKPLSTSQQY
jgi:hypothetical protein